LSGRRQKSSLFGDVVSNRPQARGRETANENNSRTGSHQSGIALAIRQGAEQKPKLPICDVVSLRS
jgi:hypothetical protein